MRNFYTFKHFIAASALVLSMSLNAQTEEFTDGSLTYAQDFNTLESTLNSDTNEWSNGTTPLLGWYSYANIDPATPSSGVASTQYATGGCNTGTGGLDFGVAGRPNSFGFNSDPNVPNTDRALGFRLAVASGDAALMLNIKNNSSMAITQLEVTYTGEQWSAIALNSQKLYFSYKIDANSPIDDAATFTSVPALDFTSLILGTGTGGTTTMYDGNLTANRTEGITATFNVAIPIGSTITLKWLKGNGDAGNDHSLAIDDLTVTATQGTLGVDEVKAKNNFKMNVVNKDLKIDNRLNAPYNISIFDLAGRTVYSRQNMADKTIDLNTLNSGIYVVKAQLLGKHFTKKIILN